MIFYCCLLIHLFGNISICVFSDIDEIDDSFSTPGQIRVQSPFNAFFKRHVIDVNEQKEEGSESENPYYLPEVINMMVKDYMPLLPLWTGLMLEKEGDSRKTRDNNAPVEAWMNVIKNSILRKERSMRVGKLIRLIHRDLKGRLRKHVLVVEGNKARTFSYKRKKKD